MKSVKSRVRYIAYVSLATLILLEICLRIYNPIPLRIKGDKIVLPINQKMIFSNDFDCFDKQIIHTKNDLGFRGKPKPDDLENYLSIVAIGGSTTECFFVSDDKVWTQVLEDSLQNHVSKVWVNNAGLNGHSTFGHKILLQDLVAPLHPDYVLFLIGINELDRDDLGEFDKKNLKGFHKAESSGLLKNIILFLANNTEIGNLTFNLSKSLAARNKRIFIDQVLELNPSDTLSIAQEYQQKLLADQKELIPAYLHRVARLDSICRSNDIKPVFITQPLLYGFGTDPETHTDLATYRSSQGMNGSLYWQKLELYNDALRSFCKDKNDCVIDLAALMPKDSRYFYDEMHFSNAGSIEVGQIIYSQLFKYLAENTPIAGNNHDRKIDFQ